MLKRTHLSRRRWVPVVGLVALAGCMVGPNYQKPEAPTPMPDAWQEAATANVIEGQAPLQTWWTVFEDPKLAELLERAQASNLDLQQAVWRIQAARASRGIAKGELLPGFAVTGEAGRSDPSANVVQIEELAQPQNLFALGVDAGWELDVFGRIRRQIESADASLGASVEDYRDVLVTLLADVAVNYIEVRSLQLRIEFAESNAQAQRETRQITVDRFNAGLVSRLDITQADSNLANTEARIPALRAQASVALNRLAVLLGETPGALDDELDVAGTIPVPPERITIGLPAELLRQRPDIRRAERELAAQTARIGAVTAELYPRFSLFGFLGLQSTDLGDLFDGDSGTWGLRLPFTWNIWQGGRIRSAIKVEEAVTEQAIVVYELAVLAALEEVENSMARYYEERLRREKLAEAVEASEHSVSLVRTQYLAGLTNFQNVLDTQRSLFNQQDQLAESEGLLVQNLVSLYKALGGGWSPEDIALPPSRIHEVTDREPPEEG